MQDCPPPSRQLVVESLEARLNQSVAAPTSALALINANIFKSSLRTVQSHHIATLESIGSPVILNNAAPAPTPSDALSTPLEIPSADIPLRRRRTTFFDAAIRNTPASPQVSPAPAAPATSTVTQTPKFTVASLVSQALENTGFRVGSAVVRSNANPTATQSLEFTIKSSVQQDANTVVQTWATASSEVTVTATLTTQGNDRRMDVSVTAAVGWNIDNIELAAPRIYAPVSADLRTYSTFKGGLINQWSTTGWGQQNSSAWPNMGYSPLGVFYNEKTTEGVVFIAFDGGLQQREVFWVTGPGQIHPYVRWHCNIKSGQTSATTLAEHHGFNMPNDGFTYYRNTFLVPFMQSQGVSEGTINLTGVMARDNWPLNGNVATSVRRALSLGINNYFQYAPPDGISYYEPNPQTISWYPSLKLASQQKGLAVLGVLIDPLMKSRAISPTTDVNSPQWFPGGSGTLSLLDADAQRFHNRLRDDLVAQGVNFAFWDTGTTGRAGEELAWFNLLKSWKQAGISIAAESSCDLASYITGTNLFDQFHNDFDYSIVKAVTPQARITVLDHRQKATNGVYWWDAAIAKGFIPMLDDIQMYTWAKNKK